MDELDTLLDSILSGTPANVASDNYLSQILGIDLSNKNYMPFGHSANGSMMGNGSRQDGITDPSQLPRDENGYITGRAATFATPSDLANYARTGSLATGDNGIGAFGHNTARLPGVAVPRDVLASVYGSPAAANGRTVEVISPNGNVARLPILDVGPRLRNRANDALIELTPSAAQLLGSGDARGYKFKFE